MRILLKVNLIYYFVIDKNKIRSLTLTGIHPLSVVGLLVRLFCHTSGPVTTFILSVSTETQHSVDILTCLRNRVK